MVAAAAQEEAPQQVGEQSVPQLAQQAAKAMSSPGRESHDDAWIPWPLRNWRRLDWRWSLWGLDFWNWELA